MTPAPDVISIAFAIMADHDDEAMSTIDSLSFHQRADALYAACVALAGCWHVDAVEMGMSDEDYVANILDASHRMERK